MKLTKLRLADFIFDARYFEVRLLLENNELSNGRIITWERFTRKQSLADRSCCHPKPLKNDALPVKINTLKDIY